MGSEERRQVHAAGHLQDQNTIEASDEGGREACVWEGCDGEGEARQDGSEGLPCGRLEEELLSRCLSLWMFLQGWVCSSPVRHVEDRSSAECRPSVVVCLGVSREKTK